MQVNGKKLKTATGSVLLNRAGSEPVALQIKAIRIGFAAIAEKLFPPPTPPKSFMKGASGNILRDPSTKKPILDNDHQDPSYKESMREASKLQEIVWLYEALKDDPSLEFETTAPGEGQPDDEWRAFYRQLYQEFQDSGFTAIDFGRIFDEIGELSNISSSMVEEEAEGFLSSKDPVE